MIHQDGLFCSLNEDEIVARKRALLRNVESGPTRGVGDGAAGEAPRCSLGALQEEWAATQTVLRPMMEAVSAQHSAQGWNVGWNVGPVGGQTVPRAQCHLVPGYADEPFATRWRHWWHPDNARP